jgi:hypothetical protein
MTIFNEREHCDLDLLDSMSSTSLQMDGVVGCIFPNTRRKVNNSTFLLDGIAKQMHETVGKD